MKILYLNITTFFANKDMLNALEHYRDEKGQPLEIIKYPYLYEEKKARKDEVFEEEFQKALREHVPDFVFSFNFLPVVSKVCNKENVIYVSWVYDNPEVFLYSFQVINPCNIVLMFDSDEYKTFVERGVNTVHYLPLAASTRRLDAIVPTPEEIEKFNADISFVGSLYTERKQYFEEIYPELDPYTQGYLDALINSQLQVDGLNFIEASLSPEIIARIQDVVQLSPYPDGAESLEFLIANYIINREITIRERREILTMIGKKHPLKLFTYNQNSAFSAEGITNMGPADYFLDMPIVFKESKINLNITLRSIKHAIPLRVFDILGAGGFLISNYQADLVYHFVPDEDFVYYESRDDLLNKIDYYLAHDDERKAIAENAHRKISEYHTFDVRVEEILDIVKAHGS